MKILFLSILVIMFQGCSVMTDTITVNIGDNFKLFDINNNEMKDTKTSKINKKIENNISNSTKEFYCTYEVNQSKPHIFSTESTLKAVLHCIKK